MSQNQISKIQRIQTFDSLQIYTRDRSLFLKGEKFRSLLAYLILHPRIVQRREMIADLLWPDSPPDRVRRNLSDLLYRLQKIIEPGWLTVDRNTITFQPDVAVQVDVWDFDSLIANKEANSLEKAVNLYTGDLLPEIYDDWLLVERELRRSQYLAALETLSAHYEAQGTLQPALLYARRLILAEPLHEPAHQAYLRLLGRLKRFGEAKTHYSYLRRLMRSELNSEPMAATRALAQSLERERSLESASMVVEEASRFVGRTSERAAALAVVERMLHGEGHLLAVEGEAGIGKSRLLREVLAGARWRGATGLYGQARETPGASPFFPLAEALMPLINSPRGRQIEMLLTAETLAALAPLNPAWERKMFLQNVSPEQAGSRFYTALHSLGEALVHSTPVVVAIDDLHWADPVLLECLRVLAQAFAHHCGLLLLAYRRPEIEHLPGWQIIQDWERDGLLKIISLESLSIEDVAELVGETSKVDPAELWAWTGGNPFFVNEWLAEPESKRSEKHGAIPLRLQTLSPDARGVLETASILGESVPYQLWVEVSESSPLVLADLGDELMARRWLHPSKEGYAFNHDLIRTAIYDEMEPARRRTLHARAAQAYLTHDPGNLRARAFHLDHAGLIGEAAHAYRLVGEQERGRFAFREAQQSLERALLLLPALPSVERIETALTLADVYEITGDQQRRRSLLEEALEGARHLENDDLIIKALLGLGKLERRRVEVPEAKAHFTEALRLARNEHDQLHELEAIYEIGYLASEQGQWKEAQEYFTQALELADVIPNELRRGRAVKRGLSASADNERQEITLTLARIRKSIRNNLAFQIGAQPQEVQQHEKELIIHRRNGDRQNQLTTQLWLLGAYYNLSAWDRLLPTAEEVLALAEAMGDRGKAATAQHILGLAFYALGDNAKARPRLVQAEREYESIGLPRNAGLSRNVLGLVAENEGNYEEALYHYRAALAGAEARETVLEATYARHDLGALLLKLDKPLDAIPQLEAARSAWSEQGNKFLCLKSEAFLGLALFVVGERARAKELAASGWTAFQEGVPDGEQPQAWLWALYRLLKHLNQPNRAQDVLRAAYAELQRQGQKISDRVLQHNFFERVPLNLVIVKAHDELIGGARTLSVSLARKDVPLGRSLHAEDFLTVQWTVTAPEDESIPDKSARRRYRLRRLLGEATSQGAAPTDDDLARALGVSRRTILRDMQSLAQDDSKPATRRRRG